MPQVTSYEHGTPSWVDIGSPDLDETASFYEQLFGWTCEEAEGDPELNGGYRMFTQDGKNVAGAGPLQQEGQPPAWTTYVTVDDADEAAAKIKENGGQAFLEPMDVLDVGRMGVFADPQGAAFAVWQAKAHIGSELVNEPVSLTWNELRTTDPEAAQDFYGKVFGWGTAEFGPMPGYRVWTLGEGEDNAVGGVMSMPEGLPEGTPPHWGVSFAVADPDAIAAKAKELGGSVFHEPFDTPIGRMTVLADPHGATFVAVTLSDEAT